MSSMTRHCDAVILQDPLTEAEQNIRMEHVFGLGITCPEDGRMEIGTESAVASSSSSDEPSYYRLGLERPAEKNVRRPQGPDDDEITKRDGKQSGGTEEQEQKQEKDVISHDDDDGYMDPEDISSWGRGSNNTKIVPVERS